MSEAAALERAIALLEPDVRPAEASAAAGADGYLDLLGPGGPSSTGRAQDLMLTRALPAIYERWWRPAWARVVRGPGGIVGGMDGEHRVARLLLALSAGDGVLDVACGPGNFTRDFARTVGPAGLAVGIDASETMLARAVDDTPPDAVAYVRGDAVRLPFRDASFDAVCCFAALHLFAEPETALDHMTRVLTPGGRIAIFTSCRTRTPGLRLVDGLVGRQGGMRMFEHDEVTAGLRRRGFTDVQQRVGGFTQFVGGRLGA